MCSARKKNAATCQPCGTLLAKGVFPSGDTHNSWPRKQSAMKYHVELHLKPDCVNKAIDAFELRGPSRHPGVTFRQGWIDTRSHIVFIVVESAEQQLVEQAAQSWSQFGTCQIHPVIDIEQY
jgi:hypothetical protein